jgi:hypothetical protein
MKESGTYKTIWEKMVEKYGLDGAIERNKSNGHQTGNKKGAANRGVPKTEEHKQKISQTVSNLHESGAYSNVKLGRKKRMRP